MNTVCDLNMCMGCMGCINICNHNAIRIEDSLVAYNAIINPDRCVDCNLCKKVCPQLNKVSTVSPIVWKQGWAEESIRKGSASGGAASAIIKSFIKAGGYVSSCLFENGEFVFKTTNDMELAKKFAGSKYVKSNPKYAYKEIKKLLNQGEKVLFIGLPCQTAALINFCHRSDKLYTIDLICHGTPSPKLLKQYLSEIGIEYSKISDIGFRDTVSFGLSNNGKRLVPKRVLDAYMLAFLNSVNYTENCYHCSYAQISRVADITLGDAWGQLSDTCKYGVSLILCQSRKGEYLLNNSGLTLENVDLNKAVDANHQLRHPSILSSKRTRFFKFLINGRSFKLSTFYALPMESIKQNVKKWLIKVGMLKDIKNGK